MYRIAGLIIVLLCVCHAFVASAQEPYSYRNPYGYVNWAPYSFIGEAQGGTLIIRYNKSQDVDVHYNVRQIEVKTEKGESDLEIVRKIVAAMPKNLEGYDIDDYINLIPSPLPDFPSQWSFSLPGRYGGFATAGTETGLSIPKALTNLSATLDEEGRLYTLAWHNPKIVDGTLLCLSVGFRYNKLIAAVAEKESFVISKGATLIPKQTPLSSLRIPTTSNTSSSEERTVDIGDGLEALPIYPRLDTSHLLDTNSTRLQEEFDESTLRSRASTIRLIVIQHAVVSNFAVLQVDGRRQIDNFIEYFTGNIAPNWTAWQLSPEAEGIRYLEGRKKDSVEGEDGEFCQIIQSNIPGSVGGIHRKFLGLLPGYTYRISARLNTLELQESDENWAVSFHAALDDPEKHAHESLTSKQMAGIAPLPNGESGFDAACVGRFTAKNPTDGEWIQCDSGDPQGMMTQDIFVPEGYSSLSIWVRFQGGATGDAVGIDWVALEDLGV